MAKNSNKPQRSKLQQKKLQASQRHSNPPDRDDIRKQSTGGPGTLEETLQQSPGLPPGRWPLIVLFFSITIGSFFVWSWFQRVPNLNEYIYEVVATHPHDSNSFTQGLIFQDGVLYESTGQYGASKIRKIDLESGRIIKDVDLDDDLFGEGLAAVGDRLYQLTWKEKTVIVYDKELNEIARRRYEGQGWGLTYDGRELIMSDGTSTLRFLDPETFKEKRSLTVRKGDRRMDNINELEYINGAVYANVLNEDSIYQISPLDGKVLGRINMNGILPYNQRRDPRNSVLNGIAVHPNGNLLVTGKNWPKVFEVQISSLQ